MRGAERPANVKWTRPFLPPLKPLPIDAARQTFIDIADDVHDHGDVDKLLRLTDNMPLAVNLVAHLADHEGCANVMSRWEEEKIFFLSGGHDKKSNLDISITLSVSSPRMVASPDARDLLSLLSLLPDGLSDIELHHSELAIPNILSCKATLIRTSLAYVDHDNRLKTLVPIREYMSQIYPPTTKLIHPIRNYLQELLELYMQYYGHLSGARLVDAITSNLGNLHNILMIGLRASDHHDLRGAAECVLSLNYFNRVTNHGHSPLMDHVQNVIPGLGDHKLHAQLITSMFMSSGEYQIQNPEFLIHQAQEYFHEVEDKEAECECKKSCCLLLALNITQVDSFLQLGSIIRIRNMTYHQL